MSVYLTIKIYTTSLFICLFPYWIFISHHYKLVLFSAGFAKSKVLVVGMSIAIVSIKSTTATKQKKKKNQITEQRQSRSFRQSYTESHLFIVVFFFCELIIYSLYITCLKHDYAFLHINNAYEILWTILQSIHLVFSCTSKNFGIDFIMLVSRFNARLI